MKLYKSLTLTFAMYSVIPMPRTDWDEESMEWVFSCFPLVGLVEGALLWLWLTAARWMEADPLVAGAVATALPVLLTGGIHLDGLCDTFDALGSHQPRERKLEILKDSHIGAFGVIGCALYLILLFSLWCGVYAAPEKLTLAAAVPVVGRSMVSLAAITRRNARGSGLLATFTAPAAGVGNRVVIGLWVAASLLGLGLYSPFSRWMLLSVLALSWYFYRMTERAFGGITGDLAGWYLELLELVMLLALALS